MRSLRWLSEIVFTTAALPTGVALQREWFSRKWDPTQGTLLGVARSGAWVRRDMSLRLILGPVLLFLVFWGVRILLRWAVGRIPRLRSIRGRYRSRDGWLYGIFVLTFLGPFGVYVAPFVLLLFFAAAQATLIWKLSPRPMDSATQAGLTHSGAVMLPPSGAASAT